MLEDLSILGYSTHMRTVKMLQVQKISREVRWSEDHDPSETTRRSPFSRKEIQAYLQGALHDASRNKHTRIRFVQKGSEWLKVLKDLLQILGHKSWMYREGKDREVYALETTAQFLDFNLDPNQLKESVEQIAYIRGFFDAEGGIPRNLQSIFYIQLVQKDKIKIQKLKAMLAGLNISSGLVHNPSVKVDPDYWRIFVSTESHRLFVKTIGSWHPRKCAILRDRMMI